MKFGWLKRKIGDPGSFFGYSTMIAFALIGAFSIYQTHRYIGQYIGETPSRLVCALMEAARVLAALFVGAISLIPYFLITQWVWADQTHDSAAEEGHNCNTKTGGSQMLIEALKVQQQELGSSDGEFARRLGISRPLWAAVCTGKRSVGVKLLRGVVRAFPDLDDEVLEFLRDPKEANDEIH